MKAIEASGAESDTELVRLWLVGRPASTVKAYTADLAWWARFGLPPRGGWRRMRFRDYEAALVRSGEKTASEATTARRIATLRSLLAWAHRVGYCPLNIGAVIRPGKAPNKLAERILEPDEVLRLLAAAGEAPRTGPRDHLLVRIGYVSGARVDELVGLDFEHVHAASKGGAILTLHGKGSKTRHVWITQGSFDEIVRFDDRTEWRSHETSWCGPIFRTRFRTRLGVRDAERVIERAAKRAKLGKVSPHWLRHAHATHALERGAPIHEVASDLGHVSIATTSRYLHARPGSGSARWLGL